PTRVYKAEDAAAFLAGTGLDAEPFSREIDGKFFSGFVRATKPAVVVGAATSSTRSCCGPDRCP
ncbi:MAG: arsenite methyltransferase, partial [Gemmatimonadaceae bacterium]